MVALPPPPPVSTAALRSPSPHPPHRSLFSRPHRLSSSRIHWPSWVCFSSGNCILSPSVQTYYSLCCAIASGAVKKAVVLSVARATNLKPSISVAYRNAIQENEQLRRANESLKRKTEMHDQMFLMLFAKMGEELPEWFLRGRSNAHTQGNTDSSHVSSKDGPMDHDVRHGNIEGDNDGENIGGDDNNCGFNLDGASGGGSY